MTKINPKSYTYILAVVFALGGLIYINLIDEADEAVFKKALASGKKEVFVGKLKSINLVGLNDELVFYKPDGSLKKFLVSEINTSRGLKPKDIVAEEWYEVVKIVNANKIIDMHKSVHNLNLDETKELSPSDKKHIQQYIDNEFTIDLILSGISIILILFSFYKINKYQKQSQTV